MAHGYLREYDEGWERGDDRERNDWRAQDWNQDRRDRERGRGFMLGDEERDRSRDRDRGFFSRTGGNRQDRGAWENNRDWPQRGRGFSSNPDDHYRSWRDRQMESLDRDYEDYCREREQQFHRDFDNWRQNRQPGRQQSPMTQQSQPGGSAQDELILGSQQTVAANAGNTPSPASEATLGTNNSENSGVGRGGRTKTE